MDIEAKNRRADDSAQQHDTSGGEHSASDYSADGVDRTLIRWMLSLTPAQRLQAVQEQVNAVQQMRAQNLSRGSGDSY